MNRNLYVLDRHEPRLADSVMEWMRWYSDASRVVARTAIGDVVEVVTMFRSIAPLAKSQAVENVAKHGRLLPALFETTVYIGLGRINILRSRTLTQAQAGEPFIGGQVQGAASSAAGQPK